jgi:hypothetical protein
VLLEKLRGDMGAAGIGPTETGGGWQKQPVKRVTLRDIENRKGRDITIEQGASGIVFENVVWHQADSDRSLFKFDTGNPNFVGHKPDVTFKGKCYFTGGAKLFNDRSRAVLKFEGEVFYNGNRVT